MPRSADKLTFALSSGEWVTRYNFKRVFDRLYMTDATAAGFQLDDVEKHRRDTARNLEALAVCDFVYGADDRVMAQRPHLVHLPQAGLPAAVLAGARTPAILSRLKTVVRGHRDKAMLNVATQPAFVLLPNRIEVQTTSVEVLQLISESSELALATPPPAGVLLGYALSIDAYLASLRWEAFEHDPNWSRDDFNPDQLRFRSGSSAHDGYRLSRYTRPTLMHRREHFLINGTVGAKIDPDWGRYAALRAASRSVLLYDQRQALLLTPASCPLPRIFARALTLCSGFAPQEFDVQGNLMRGFCRIPRVFAETAANKLGQQLSSTSLPELRGCP